MSTQRYLVHGYYTDEPQVVIDVIDADSAEAAEAEVNLARAGDYGTGYTCDGAECLDDAIDNLKDLKQRSTIDVAKGIQSIADQYAHWRATRNTGDTYR